MSHISLIKIALKNPNMHLLKYAVEALAKELGGEVVTQIRDYYGNRTKVELGIKSRLYSRGVGIVVKKGQVKLKGDFWGYNYGKAEQLQKALTKNYTAVATVSSLRNLGYKVQTQKVKQNIYIKAYAY